MDAILADLVKNFPALNTALAAGIYVFARLIGFFRFSPVFNRKEIPGMVKICLALLMTCILTPFLKPETLAGTTDSFALSILLNFAAGAIIGYMAQLILLAVDAGADMINMQMGLSSAMVLDPTAGAQVSILGNFFGLLAVILFIDVGGVYWLVNALHRSFEIFPVYATAIPMDRLINKEYLVTITSNVLYIGLQIASPVLLATLGQDLILGIISKTAPQVNVFQLSFLFKPVLGAAILLWIMPIIVNVINDYFISFAKIF